MRSADVDILIIPGCMNSGPDHWQSRWARNFKTAQRIEQEDWETPQLEDWVRNIQTAVESAPRRVVLVAHSCGVIAAVHAAPRLPASKVAGAFLVAAPDLDSSELWPAKGGGFVPVPLDPLPFPSVLIASSQDPSCTPERAREFAHAWRSTLVEAGNVGHLNAESGHGPWPEGLLRFGQFLKDLA